VKCIRARYKEHASLGHSGNAAGISVTPFAAGHSVGGTIWRIRKNTEDILYAVNYNHKRERHLDGAALDLITARPSLLITDVKQALSVHVNKKQRDADLSDSVIATLRANGSVLIPTCSSTRLLEVAFLLEDLWAQHRFPYKIFLLSPQAEKIILYAKSMLEWMSEAVIKSFGLSRENPVDFKYKVA
jgi:cleavage and polyadenylation specificity factor subunit 2